MSGVPIAVGAPENACRTGSRPLPHRRTPPLTPEAFRRETGVSRETLERLDAYLRLLVHWQRRINLVGAASLADPWRRHMLDSAQLFPLLPDPCTRLVDLGSGAGFPGLVLAIMGVAGVDISLPPGSLVRASRSGKVAVAANQLEGYGPTVLLQHSDGYVTVYAGLADLLARPGEMVQQGRPIARIGSHALHFQIRQGTTARDPLSLLP